VEASLLTGAAWNNIRTSLKESRGARMLGNKKKVHLLYNNLLYTRSSCTDIILIED